MRVLGNIIVIILATAILTTLSLLKPLYVDFTTPLVLVHLTEGVTRGQLAATEGVQVAVPVELAREKLRLQRGTANLQIDAFTMRVRADDVARLPLSLIIRNGAWFATAREIVIGHTVARAADLSCGNRVTLYGEEQEISGVLKATGTPIDMTILLLLTDETQAREVSYLVSLDPGHQRQALSQLATLASVETDPFSARGHVRAIRTYQVVGLVLAILLAGFALWKMPTGGQRSNAWRWMALTLLGGYLPGLGLGVLGGLSLNHAFQQLMGSPDHATPLSTVFYTNVLFLLITGAFIGWRQCYLTRHSAL
jgi:hypothetical protein